MIVNLTADLVAENYPGQTIEPLDLLTIPEPFRSKLVEFLQEVRERLGDTFPQSKVPTPGTSPSTTMARYQLILQYAFKEAVQNLGLDAGNEASDVEITLGAFVVGSVWIPSLEIWDARPGAAWGLNLVLKGLPMDAAFSPETPVFLNVRPVIADGSEFCTYELQFVDEASIVGAAIFLGAARSRPRAIRTAPRTADSSACSSGQRRFAEVSDGLWIIEGHLPTDKGCMAVQIEFDGDPPHVRDVTALIDGAATPCEAPARPSPDDPFPTPPRAVDPADTGVLQSYAYPKDVLFAYRTAKVCGCEEHDAAQRFFLALDEATQPDALPPPGQADAHATPPVNVNALGGILTNQYLRRAEAYHFDEPFELAGPGLAGKLELAKPAGKLIRSLMKAHFQDDGSGCSDAIRRAFERFASGELTVLDTMGAPNGTNMFSFAELALVHIEARVDTAVWMRLFRIFGHAAEIFAGCYHKCGDKRTHCSYRVENNPTGERAPSQLTRDDLWSIWDIRFPKRRYDQLIYAALRDDMIQAYGSAPTRPTLSIQDFGCGRADEPAQPLI